MHFLAIPIAELATLDYRSHFPQGPVNLITLADPALDRPAKPAGVENHLHLYCCDIDEPIPGFRGPIPELAQEIVAFYDRHPAVENWLVACTAGAGRSAAVVAGLARLAGLSAEPILARGTYNRLLYRLVVEVGGSTVPSEPLVSMVVRLKYPMDRLLAFYQCLRRQRWKNWELIVVTDGPERAPEDNSFILDKRVVVLRTTEKRGRWGHPYRQKGIALSEGEFIGLSNDDNYYVPGYLDQMMYALESQQADLVLCDYLSHYRGWEVVQTRPVAGQCDLGCWLARATLVKATPWEGMDFASDGYYVERLAAKANKVVHVSRPLFVHN